MKTPIITRIVKRGEASSDGLLLPIFAVEGQDDDGRWYPFSAHGSLRDAIASDRTIPAYWEQV